MLFNGKIINSHQNSNGRVILTKIREDENDEKIGVSFIGVPCFILCQFNLGSSYGQRCYSSWNRINLPAL